MRDSLEQKFTNTISKCDICLEGYNRNRRQPVIICTMHHTICRQCLQQLSNRKCPFCRQDINNRKILLPSEAIDSSQANLRQQADNNQLINRSQSAANVNNYHSVNNIISNNNLYHNWNNNINNELYRRVSSQDSRLPPSLSSDDPRVVNWLHFRDEIEDVSVRRSGSLYGPSQYLHIAPSNIYANYQPQMIHNYDNNQSCCCFNIDGNNLLNLDDSQLRKPLYIYVFLIQIPFIICNLCFSLISQYSECMDLPHQSTAYVVRTWFLAIGIFEISVFGLLLLLILIRIIGCISFDSLQIFQIILAVIIICKVLMWAIMQVIIYFAGINQFCSGGFHTYALILTIIHCILLSILGCLSSCKR